MRFRASPRFSLHTLYTQRRAWHPRDIACRVAVLVAFLGSTASLRADDPLLKQLFDRQAKTAIEQAKSPHKPPTAPEGSHILVLADGRVIDGAIRGDLHGYRVETPEASMFFTFDQVQLVARDRHEAYEKMCATEPTTTPVRRDIRLGRWCLENRLPREAAFHLRKVLEFDPSNQEAKALLTRLEASQTAPGGFVKVGGMTEHVAPDAKVVESLARLSPDRVKEFVIGVQPILLAPVATPVVTGDRRIRRFISTACIWPPAATGTSPAATWMPCCSSSTRNMPAAVCSWRRRLKLTAERRTLRWPAAPRTCRRRGSSPGSSPWLPT